MCSIVIVLPLGRQKLILKNLGSKRNNFVLGHNLGKLFEHKKRGLLELTYLIARCRSLMVEVVKKGMETDLRSVADQ